MDLGLIFTLCGLGTAFLIPALILMIISTYKRRKCTASADAVVIDIKVRSSSVDHGLSFHPVYEYHVDGVRYTGVGAAISNNTPSINTVVPIMYDPCHPKRSYISGRDNKIYKILSMIFAVIGLIPIVICVCIAMLS